MPQLCRADIDEKDPEDDQTDEEPGNRLVQGFTSRTRPLLPKFRLLAYGGLSSSGMHEL